MTRTVLILLHLFLGVSAIGAGSMLILDPSGDDLSLPIALLDGSPFTDYRIPGLFLAIVIGSTNLLSGLALWRRDPIGPPASLGTGILLLAWISVQTAILGFHDWTQAVWWAVFALVTWLAARLVLAARTDQVPSDATRSLSRE